MPAGLTYAYGAHAVELEVDPETGMVELTRYVVVNDAGRLVNPTIVEGQLHGGVVHGIGNALFEHMVYDDQAQPVSTNFGEYLLPTATEVPRMELSHIESASPMNPLGVKGVGETGVLPVAPAIVSAIEDALSEWGVEIDAYPVTPQRILELIAQARG
jgi:carbon-monoxide dehydrogenase large subunit